MKNIELIQNAIDNLQEVSNDLGKYKTDNSMTDIITESLQELNVLKQVSNGGSLYIINNIISKLESILNK